MKPADAIAALSALAQDHRLAVFRLLVRAGPEGLSAGRIAEALGVPNSSLSHHLAQLHDAGLIAQRREGRSLVYSADYAAMDRLVGFLMENCCAGSAASDPACETKEICS
jgi:ArsR family transcriptional regulator, arsenate/arsenite/antimonite-responsive transcriptional repressor